MLKSGQTFESTAGAAGKTDGVFKKGKTFESLNKEPSYIFPNGRIATPSQVLEEALAPIKNPNSAQAKQAVLNYAAEQKPTAPAEKTLSDKVFLDSAQKKKITGENLTVAEIGALMRNGKTDKKITPPQNKSQAYLKLSDMRAENWTKFENAVRASEDFMNFYSKGSRLKTGQEKQGNFLERFSADYQEEKTPRIDMGLYSKIKKGDGIYSTMTGREKEVYYYLAGKGDNAKIREYILQKKPELESRYAADTAKNRSGFSGFVKNTADAAKTGLSASLTDMARSGVALGSASNTVQSPALLSLLQPTYREKLYSAIRENAYDRNKLEGLFYDVVNTSSNQIAEQIASLAGGQGAYISALAMKILGSNATADINEGRDAFKSILKSAFDVALEFAPDQLLGGASTFFKNDATPKLLSSVIKAIDKSFENKTVAGLFAKAVTALASSTGEGLEEFFQNLAEPIVNNIVYGEDIHYEKDTFENAVQAFVIGFFSAAPLSVAGAGAKTEESYRDIVGSDLKKNAGVKPVLDLAEVVQNHSDLFYSVKDEYEAGRNVENTELADLYMESANQFVARSDESVQHYVQKNVDALIRDAKGYMDEKNGSNGQSSEKTV